MKRLIIISIFIFALTGCATTNKIKSLVGQDIRQAVLEFGQPVNYVDMPNGVRAFQWQRQLSFHNPQTVTTYGSATTYGRQNTIGNVNAYGGFNAVSNGSATTYGSQTATVSGGNTVHYECRYTLFAKWDYDLDGWRVIDFKKPDFGCE